MYNITSMPLPSSLLVLTKHLVKIFFYQEAQELWYFFTHLKFITFFIDLSVILVGTFSC